MPTTKSTFETLVVKDIRRGKGYNLDNVSYQGTIIGKTKTRIRFFSPEFLKFLYLACATFISTTLIVECILIQLVIKPYLSESVFKPGYCKFDNSEMSQSSTCENKCSKERSKFPCLRIKVYYTPITEREYEDYRNKVPEKREKEHMTKASPLKWFSTNETRAVFLYDSFSTYSSYHNFQCSNAPCYKREADNNRTVVEFKKNLLDKDFLCFAKPYDPSIDKDYSSDLNPHRSNNPDSRTFSEIDEKLETLDEEHHKILEVDGNPLKAAALLNLNFSTSIFLHSVFWPIFILLSSSMILFILYVNDGCKVWKTDSSVIA